MARTFEVLRPRVVAAKKTLAGLDPSVDYTKDARCLSCHTTGHGEPSGYPEVAAGAEMTAEQREAAVRNEGVTCEACHGPGSLYGPYKKEHADHELADVVQLGLVSPPTAQDCTRCHVPECPTMPANYVFRFERAVGTTEAIHGHRPLRSHDAVGGR